MSIRAIIGGIASLVALCVVAVLFATPTPVSANGAAFCQSQNFTGDARTACENGYNNAGSADEQECSTYPTDDQKNACLEGRGHRLSTDRDARISSGERCSVIGLGWVVCAVSVIIGYLADGLFYVLEQLLAVSPLDQNEDGGKELYKIWGMFRSIANVVFIIIFMVVILSHTTNFGLDNYSLKRTMPRMIVGALLINLSFIICGLLVDAANIIGTSIKDILSAVAIPVQPQFSAWDSVIGVALIGAGGVSVYLSVFAIVPIIFSGIVALFMTVVILVVRHALIICLVIIAPLAFALNILPSTQKWFSKWWSSFIVLVMVFPAIAFIFGATKVAAGVVSASAPDGAIGTLIFGTFALGVQSIPFFVTPILLKVGGGLLNRFTGIVNNPSKGLIDRGRRRVDQWATNKTNVRESNALVGGTGLHAAVTKHRSRTGKVADYHKKQLSSHTSGVFGEFTGQKENRERLAASVARNTANPWAADGDDQYQKATDRLNRELAQAKVDVDVEAIDAAEASLIDRGYEFSDLQSVLNTGLHKDGSAVTSDEKAAAIKRMASQSGGDVDTIHELLDKVAEQSNDTKSILALADGIDASGVASSAAHLDKNATNQMRAAAQSGAGIQNSSQLAADAANRNIFTDERVSTQSAGTINKLAQAHQEGLLSDAAYNGLVTSRSKIDSREKLRVNQSAQARRALRDL